MVIIFGDPKYPKHQTTQTKQPKPTTQAISWIQLPAVLNAGCLGGGHGQQLLPTQWDAGWGGGRGAEDDGGIDQTYQGATVPWQLPETSHHHGSVENGVSPIWVSFHLRWFSTEPWLWEKGHEKQWVPSAWGWLNYISDLESMIHDSMDAVLYVYKYTCCSLYCNLVYIYIHIFIFTCSLQYMLYIYIYTHLFLAKWWLHSAGTGVEVQTRRCRFLKKAPFVGRSGRHQWGRMNFSPWN